MDSKKHWMFVALFDGKKVKKCLKTLEGLGDIDWITETKFWFRDKNKTHCEGIVLTKNDDKRILQKVISKKPPRIPHNTFKPFPDPNIKPINLAVKWKKKLATLTINSSSTSEKNQKARDEEELIENHAIEKSSISEKLTKGNEKPTTQTNKDEIISESSDEDDQSSSNSTNVIQHIRNKRKIISFTNSEKEIRNSTLGIDPDQFKKIIKKASKKDTITEEKYEKLYKKYKNLKQIYIAQSKRYAKDLQIRRFAARLCEAIESRYSSDDEDD